MSDYPETVTEVRDPNMRFKPAALWAVRAFAKTKPWKGTVVQRKEKFRNLNRNLAAAYGITEPELDFGTLEGGHSGSSHYIPAVHRIVLVGRASVVSFLHEFAHARGMGERGACRWSINLFRRVFPKQYAKLSHDGHMLIRRGQSTGRAFPRAQFTGNPESRQ